jgi:hypothetical protein
MLSCVACSWSLEGERVRPIPGGVTFQTDDNGSKPEYWRQRATVFDKNDMKFGAAINLLAAEDTPGMIDILKEIQARGHDLMDHTPSHNNKLGKPAACPAGAGLPDQRILTSATPDEAIFRIQGLGGLPHGKAEISCWISGPAGSTVAVTVHGTGNVSFVLKEGWNRYQAPIAIPAAQATARVDFVWRSKQAGSVSVCGVAFAAEGAKEAVRVGP